MSDFIPVCEPLLDGKELEYVTEAVKTGWISSSGDYVSAFESSFAEYCGVNHGIAVCNGTVALHLALTALGVGPGDEVIIPSFTMIASAFAVCYTGAKPVFVDADPGTWNIDVARLEEKVTQRTKVVMPVHIFGNPCDMDPILALARKYGFHVLEDAAEAHGATYRGRKVGSFSSVATFSFFANKNVTTGEGGMVVSSDEDLARKCRYYKNLCFPVDRPRIYEHAHIGFNYRMSNLHAAIGLAQTERADHFRELRIRNGALYRELLGRVPGIRLQIDQVGGVNVRWMNGIVIDPSIYGHSREELIDFLKTKGVDTRLFFVGMHKQKALLDYGCDGSGAYPVTDDLGANGFYLPSGSGLTEVQIERICGYVANFGKY